MRISTALARRITLVSLAALALVASAGAAESRQSWVDVAPIRRAVQNATVEVSALVRPAGARCTLRVRYRDGASQTGLAPIRAAGGRARWRWRIPRAAAPGAARATISLPMMPFAPARFSTMTD